MLDSSIKSRGCRRCDFYPMEKFTSITEHQRLTMRLRLLETVSGFGQYKNLVRTQVCHFVLHYSQ